MKCERCGDKFEPRNPADHVTICDECDYLMALADEAARAILATQMVRSDVRFSWFRQEIINECPVALTDDEIHDLYVEHVTRRTLTHQDEAKIKAAMPEVQRAMEDFDRALFEAMDAKRSKSLADRTLRELASSLVNRMKGLLAPRDA